MINSEPEHEIPQLGLPIDRGRRYAISWDLIFIAEQKSDEIFNKCVIGWPCGAIG
jgi:hypothetical protein